MQEITVQKKAPRLFLQGFELGLIFGTLGALIMLGRQGRSQTTL